MTTALKYSPLKWRPDRLHKDDGAMSLCTSAKKPQGRCLKNTVNCRRVLKEIIPYANETFLFCQVNCMMIY